ncbi:MAG: monovalent cation/H(+) antiporter subunit G [Planctomycetota bacterium]|jgi:multicomponent Na+:H+ antiporter subunit G
MPMILDISSWVCLVAGGLFGLIGGLGLLRLPDFYARMHGSGITDTCGAWLVLLGLMLQAGLGLVTVKLVMIGLLLALTSPTSTHALAKSAWTHGLKPFTRKEEGPSTS